MGADTALGHIKPQGVTPGEGKIIRRGFDTTPHLKLAWQVKLLTKWRNETPRSLTRAFSHTGAQL